MLGSTINPFATGIASGFAGVSIDEGIVGRLVILVVGTAIGIVFVMRYAARIQADPARSLVAGQTADNEAAVPRPADDGRRPPAAMTGRQKAVLALFFLAFAGDDLRRHPVGGPRHHRVPTLCWWFPEMTASFLLFAILIGVVGRMGESDFTNTFVDGARDLLGVALIIGIARGITVIMNNGLITDTVLNAAEQAVGGLGGVAFINLMYVLFLPLSFLIPSSSGLATVAMPIMAPLASFADVPAAARRHRLPERQRPREPRHADVGRRHGRPRDRPGRLRDLAQVRVAGADPARDPDDRGAHGGRAPAMIVRTRPNALACVTALAAPFWKG